MANRESHEERKDEARDMVHPSRLACVARRKEEITTEAGPSSQARVDCHAGGGVSAGLHSVETSWMIVSTVGYSMGV